MASIAELMRGKRPGEIKIRRTGWPRNMWVIPKQTIIGFVLEYEGTAPPPLAIDNETATDWVIVTDAKRRRG